MLALYALTLFLSAVLLFWVEPLFGKLVLPVLGGAPAVWNTCLAFFQTTLLLGYLWAHILVTRVPFAAQAGVHLGVWALTALALPLGLALGWLPDPEGQPVWGLMLLLAVSLGGPFFLLATNTPLLQAWFARSHHPAGRDPYFLYAASNVGSMGALLAFPFLLEPILSLGQQSLIWSVAYLALAGLVATCAVSAGRRGAARGPEPQPPGGEPVPPPSWGQRLHWMALAAAPSALLIGVSNFITSDLAAVPLLWVVPLALYLFTFILAFARRHPVSSRLAARVQPFLVLPVAVLFLVKDASWWITVPLHLGAFVITCLVCHALLAERRPPAGRLTEFYLFMSLGGAVGGLLIVLVAPLVFDLVSEYPLTLVLACLLRPQAGGDGDRRQRLLDWGLPALILALLYAGGWLLGQLKLGLPHTVAFMALAGVAAVVVFAGSERRIRFGLGVGAIIWTGLTVGHIGQAPLYVERTFFGVHQVRQYDHPPRRELYHGYTLHGAQRLDPGRSREPLFYYHRQGPVGDIFGRLLPPAPGGRRVALAGLGAGGLTCYARAGEEWDLYELDPEVVRLAAESPWFSFLKECPARWRTILGDARLRLAEAGRPAYDVVILDAFSSDAIPVHLLTREALQVYLARLAPDGIIVVHISNRYLRLNEVVAGLARDAGLALKVRSFTDVTQADIKDGLCPSIWAVMARDPGRLAALAGDPAWQPPVAPAKAQLWTDDFSNLLACLQPFWLK